MSSFATETANVSCDEQTKDQLLESFQEACSGGHLTEARRIHSSSPDIDISANDEIAFRRASANGHWDVVDWLIGMNADIYKAAFLNACRFGHTKTAKAIQTRFPDVNLEEAFCSAVLNGHVKIVKWILTKADMNISAKDDYAFRWAIFKGHNEIVELLLSLKADIYKSAFVNACRFGQFEAAKAIQTRFPDIDISANEEEAFRKACINGHWEIARWLHSEKADLNISAKREWAFRYACSNGHYDIAEWLLSLNADILKNIDVEKDLDEASRQWLSTRNH